MIVSNMPTLKESVPPVTATGRYSHIDAIRAFAVMLVVVAHAGLGHIVPGGSGVTIFFVISGFIITHLVLKEQKQTANFDVKSFYLRRFLKIAPPFLVIVAIPTVIYAQRHPIDWADFLSQVFFVFNWVYMTGEHMVLPGSGVVWSLAIEEQFYIVFALLWVIAVKSQRGVALLTATAMAVVVISLLLRLHISYSDFSHRRTYYGTDTRVDGIAYGVLAAIIYQFLSENRANSVARRMLANDWVFLVAAVLYLFSLVYRNDIFRETFRYSIQAISALLLVLYGLLQTESRFRQWLGTVSNLRLVQIIGLSSYSIYLAHLSLNHLFGGLLKSWPEPLAILFRITTGVAAGVLVWALIERPVERFKKRLANAPTGY